MIAPNLQIGNRATHLQHQHPGKKNEIPRDRPVWSGNPTPMADRLIRPGSNIEPAPSVEKGTQSPIRKSLPISTSPTSRERKKTYPGSTPTRTMWEPQPHRPTASCLGLEKKARATIMPPFHIRNPTIYLQHRQNREFPPVTRPRIV